jgi:hypothetical protein
VVTTICELWLLSLSLLRLVAGSGAVRLTFPFARATAASGAAQDELQVLFKEVPQYNKFTLKRILMCLSKVVEASAENKMDAPNLATIFGPSFFRQPPSGATLTPHCTSDCADSLCVRLSCVGQRVGSQSAMTTDRAAIEKQVADTKCVNELAITLIKHYDTILRVRRRH